MSSRSSQNLLYVTILAVLIAEATVAFALAIPNALVPALLLHGATIAVVALWLHDTNRIADRFGRLLLPLLVVTGPFGVVMCLVAALVYKRQKPTTVSPSEWIETLFERKQDQESERLQERITQGLDDYQAASYVQPFRDILSAGTVLQKQMAIAKIGRYFRPAFAPLLLQSARSPNAAVRVQAATALANIERGFMQRCIKLETKLKNVPNGHPDKIELAKLYDDYAHAGLLDDISLQSLRTKAIAIYEACLEQKDNPEWRVHLARLYLRQGQPLQTQRCLEPVIAAGDAPRGAMFWYMEALFQLKKFGTLRQFTVHHAKVIKESSVYANLEQNENFLEVWDIAPTSTESAQHVA